MDQKQLKSYLNHLVRKFEKLGSEGLASNERAYLAFLFAGDVRKGALSIAGLPANDARQAFCDHARRVLEAGEFKVVLDYRDSIARQARELASEKRPLASLILYATWIEHWFNAVLATSVIARGSTDQDAVHLVRDAPFRAKVGWLLKLCGLPDLEAERRKAILDLTDLRNAFVHYKWVGRTPEDLEKEENRLREIVNAAHDLLEYLRSYERTHLSGDMPALAKDLFEIDIEDEKTRFADFKNDVARDA
jgi:hypothetical protein